jgi:hypothetical protein
MKTSAILWIQHLKEFVLNRSLIANTKSLNLLLYNELRREGAGPEEIMYPQGGNMEGGVMVFP